MAYYDLDEQEQIDALKAWWHRWGALLVTALVLVLGSIAAIQGWSWYKEKRSAEAAALYGQLISAAGEKSLAKARTAADALAADYASTGYATLAALATGKLAFDAGDLDGAAARLRWAYDHARDSGLKDVARLRLAGVLLDQKKYDEALGLLDPQAGEGLAGLHADLRGDVLLAKGDPAGARAAYQTALERTDRESPYRALIQVKIDALGSVK